ncbi:MAG: type 2 lanthipeptide synthetase LanM, partial [Actinomycetes bacterium]
MVCLRRRLLRGMLTSVLDPDPPDVVRSIVGWTADRLKLSRATAEATSAVLSRIGPSTSNAWHDFGYEVHLDGSDRVDLSVFTKADSGRTIESAAGVFGVGQWDIPEYDLDPGGPTLAGVFHHVTHAELPAELAGWGTPALMAAMSGRSGQLRLIFPVADAAELTSMLEELRRRGARTHVLDRLGRATGLLTTPESLRLAIEYLPDEHRIGDRVGLEVFIDPRVHDVFGVLADLGVADADATRMRELADALPRNRARRRRIPGLPGVTLPDRYDAITFVHFSLSWPRTETVLKCYLVVHSGVTQTERERRDSLVHRHGGDWTARLRLAVHALPLRNPPAETTEELSRWQAAVDPVGRDSFARRLARDGLGDDQALVVVSPFAKSSGRQPTWWPQYRDLIKAFDDHRVQAATAEDWLQQMAQELPDQAESYVPFAHLLWPAVVGAWVRFEDEHASLADGVAPSARDDLRRSLLARLSTVAAPTLSQVMWESAPFGQRFLAHRGSVPDNPPRTRYAAFCRAQADDGLTAVLTRFPVLGSLLGQVVGQWCAATAELLARLEQDRDALEDRLGIPAARPLSQVSGATGDTHNDGRSVCILGFGDLRVAYKPRSVALEDLYFRQVAALIGLTPHDPLRAAAVLACCDAGGTYGYMEYITGQPCTTDAELREFYRNAGRTLALLHALAATDCHHENLIAVGNQLVLVDAETLLDTGAPNAAQLSASVDGDTSTANPASVLRVGMLPTWLWLEGRRTALDISALGVGAGSAEPVEGRGWRAINSDLMARGSVTARIGHPTSLPTVNGSACLLTEHVEDLADGFTQAYRLLIANREVLLANWREHAVALERRIVTRPTYVYASLLGASVEPAALESATARGLVLERLTRAYLNDEGETTWPMVAAEQDALDRLDIPYFKVPLAGGRTEWLGGGLEEWPADGAFADLEARVARLSEADLNWQTSLIRASVAASTFRMTPEPAGAAVTPRETPPDSYATGRACLSAVTDAALTADGETTWMGLSLLPDGMRANVASIGSGLYDGRMGLAVALSALAAADHVNAGQAAVARDAALAPLLRLLRSSDNADLSRLMLATGPGIAGVGGLLRGLAFLRGRSNVDDESISSAQDALLGALSVRMLADDKQLDHISGA